MNKTIKHWYLEIQTVGFRNWLWFVWYLDRNEFSHKLGLERYKFFGGYGYDTYKLLRDRSRANDIDNALSDINKS